MSGIDKHNFEYIPEVTQNSELEPSREQLNQSPRVVIYGQMGHSYYGGAIKMSEVLKTYLESHNMTDDDVIMSRNIDNISDAFYRGHRSPKPTGDIKMEIDKVSRPNLMPKFLSMVMHKKQQVALMQDSSQKDALEVVKDTVPSAVFVFPKMRQYDNGNGMTVDTPIGAIEELCEKNGVPIVCISEDTTQQDLMEIVRELPASPISDSGSNSLV